MNTINPPLRMPLPPFEGSDAARDFIDERRAGQVFHKVGISESGCDL